MFCTKILPSKVQTHARDSPSLLPVLQVDPLVQLMKVEKTPDSTYEMIGGVDKQIKDLLGVAAVRFEAFLRSS